MSDDNYSIDGVDNDDANEYENKLFSSDASGRRLAGDMGRVGAGYGGHDGVAIIVILKVQKAKYRSKKLRKCKHENYENQVYVEDEIDTQSTCGMTIFLMML